MRVYIAGPYSLDPVGGTRRAIEAGNLVRELGHFPFIPHLTMFWDFLYERLYEDWIEYDREWLKQCDAMIRLPGHSHGADEEEAEAHRLKIPVYHSVTEFVVELAT